MITTEVFEAVSFYKELIEKVKIEKLDPFEIPVEGLKSLAGDNIFTNGLIISLLSKIIKLKAEYLEKHLIPQTEEEKQETIKSIFKQVLKEETNLKEDDIEALLMEESIREKLRKPKSVKTEKISYKKFQELTKNQLKEVLFENTDYNAYALEIAKQIEKGRFKIKSYKDFIGLMFAIYNFNIKINDIREFIR